MTSHRFFARMLGALALVAISACEAVDSPTATFDTEVPGEELAERTTPEPAALKASRVFEVAGDPSCCTLSGGPYATFGFRFADVSDGFHALTDGYGVGSCDNPPQDPDNGITMTVTGDGFDWSSTMPVGAVIVGSDLGARVYVYSPRSWGDSALRAISDPVTGQPGTINSIEICYDYALAVTLDVDPQWTRMVQWSIQSTATPDSWDLFPGDRAHSRIDITVTPVETVDQPPAVEGLLTIENRTPLAATVSSITNLLSGGILVPVDCETPIPFTLAPGESRECSYRREMSNSSTRTAIVTVNTTSVVRGGSDSTPVVFGPQTVVNQSIHVDGPDGNSYGPFDAAASFSVDREFDCGMLQQLSQAAFAQSAEIVETSQSAKAQVSVRKWQPTLSHEIAGHADRSWSWSIERRLEYEEVILALGQSLEIAGDISLSASPFESNREAYGSVSVANPNPSRALVVAQWEAPLLAQSEATLDCSGSLVVPASDSHRCQFSVASPTLVEGTSVVRMGYQNFELHPDGSAIPTMLSYVQSSVELRFEIVAERDHCIELRDELSGISTIQCADAMPAVLPASLQVGPFAVCGSHLLEGVAEFTALDSGTQASSAYSVGVQIACVESACTQGTGYWKVHSPGGPPPYDATWEFLPQQGAGPFFASGMSYVDVMWAPPKGSAWIQLAKPWIAARLNQLAGADASAIASEFGEAESLLQSGGPNGLTREQIQRMRQLAGILESWNSGEIGPGSCSTP